MPRTQRLTAERSDILNGRPKRSATPPRLMDAARAVADAAAEAIANAAPGPASEEVHRTIRQLMEAQNDIGYDPFGFHPEILETILPALRFLYRSYFRVDAYGQEKIPAGRAILVANHSGHIPMDGVMIGTTLLLEHDPPRMTRAMIDSFVPALPFISHFFARAGQVVGTRDNARRLLENGELLMVFPEGTGGISKPSSKRYQLQEFGLGFLRLALETNTPIIPIGVVGAEEQLPVFFNARRLGKLFGAPSVPIPATPIPLPVKYRIYFGEPLYFEGDNEDEDRAIQPHVDRVKDEIRALLKRGLDERTSVFFD